ncbi:hypothetical protein CFC21_016826 [Triticum aestivum]|uniref:Uncharacterized protein n=2 Tax=Triticum aestivum TaxID=4565 RepID=A0A9R1DZF8_WHEAT|nr:hypothetical protein CFC21_016826 [Triticum aestivum]
MAGEAVATLEAIAPVGGAWTRFADEVACHARGHCERINSLRDHREPEESGDLEEVVRAGDELEEPAFGDLVPCIVVTSLPKLRDEVVVVEVAGDANGQEEDAWVEEVRCMVREFDGEVSRVDHGDGAEQVAGGDGERRVE